MSQLGTSTAYLVLNDDAEAQVFERLIQNLLPTSCRYETLEGREHIVVPMILLTEGVHEGSKGPLFYGEDELSKTPEVWNHKPVVVYHPSKNGHAVSACDPVVINSRKIGIILNTRWSKGKLKSEAWIEKERANSVDPRIMAAVENETVMELSTSLFTDHEEKPGEWKGESYEAIARNFRPDHVALLPDKKGACSVADGAGFMRNQQMTQNQVSKAESDGDHPAAHYLVVEDPEKPTTWHLRYRDMEGKVDHGLMGACWAALHGGYRGNKYEGPGKTKALTKLKALYKSEEMEVPAENQQPLVGDELSFEKISSALQRTLSFEKISSALQRALTERLGIGTGPNVVCPLWVCDVYADFAVYDFGGKLWQIGYSTSDTGVSLSDDPPVEVVRVTEYRTLDGTYVGNATAGTQTKEIKMDTAQDETPGAIKNDPPAAKPVTLEEFVALAPDSVRGILINSLEIYNQEKARLVAAILANKHNGFSKEDLESRPLGELRNLGRLAGAGSDGPPNYSGQAPVATAVKEQEPLPLPVMNFGK